MLGSAGLMISTILPWYDQRNSFGIGETYLGIQGPLFAIGAVLLLCGAVSFFNLFFPLMGRNFFNLKKRGGSISLLLAGQAFLMLIIANSIFYHPNFGLSVSSKTSRFGMIVAFVSIGVMAIAGWWTRRTESEDEDNVEDIMQNQEPVRVVTPTYNAQTYTVPTYSAPVTPNNNSADDSVDPLTLDAKTRYKMMRSQGQHYSPSARNNFWGSQNGSGLSHLNKVEDDVRELDL